MSKSRKDWFHMLILNIIIVSFILQPTAIRELLEIFNCKNIDGHKYILTSLNISCEDDVYFSWRNEFYLPLLFFWTVIFPFGCYLALVFNSKKLDNPRMKLFFGFFYLGYRPDYYYWEFIIIYRKIFSIMITIMPENLVMAKGYIILFVNASAACFQSRKCPFIEWELNKLELKANIAAMITIFIGLFYILNIPEIAKAICFVCIIIVNNYFILNWLKFFFMVTYQEISKSYLVKKFCPTFPNKILFFINCNFCFLYRFLF